MIIFLYGPDSYRRQKRLKEIISQYKKKHSDLALERFWDDDLQQLKDFAKEQSLFASSKLAIVFPEKAIWRKEFADILKSQLNSKNTIILISYDNKPTKEFYFLLESPVLSQFFENLPPKKAKIFLQKEAFDRGISISNETLDLLIKIHGSNLWGALNDLEVLSLGGTVEKKPENQRLLELIKNLKRGSLSSVEWLISTEDHSKVFNIIASLAANRRDAMIMANYDAAIKAGKLTYEEALLDLAL